MEKMKTLKQRLESHESRNTILTSTLALAETVRWLQEHVKNHKIVCEGKCSYFDAIEELVEEINIK